MNTPPTFEQAPSYQPPRRQSNVPKILLIVFLAVCVPCIVVSFFGMRMFFDFAKKGVGMVACSFSLQSARDAMIDYSKEHGGKLPPMANWQKEIYPYYKKHVGEVTNEMKDAPDAFRDILDFDLMKDPNKQFGCLSGKDEERTSFVYNSEIAGKLVAEVQKNADTVWIYETFEKGVNLSKPPVKLDHANAPTLAGEVRGWFWIKGVDAAYLRERKYTEGDIKVKIDEAKAKKAERAEKAAEQPSK